MKEKVRFRPQSVYLRVPNCSRARASRPIIARLESGEVLLTTSIPEVRFEVGGGVLARNAALCQGGAKGVSIEMGQTRALA